MHDTSEQKCKHVVDVKIENKKKEKKKKKKGTKDLPMGHLTRNT